MAGGAAASAAQLQVRIVASAEWSFCYAGSSPTCDRHCFPHFTDEQTGSVTQGHKWNALSGPGNSMRNNWG